MTASATDNLGLNDAEQFVAQHCQRSFLSLWTYPNPQGKNGKELCDLLVVCDPDVIVMSVKHIAFKDTGNPTVDLDRWRRRAVEESVKQIFKAERWLDLDGLKDRVIIKSGKVGLAFPASEVRNLHRVAVALGGENKVFFSSRPYDDKGTSKYVHVLDGPSFGTIIQELDTITDFVTYLSAKEDLQSQVVMEGGEEDLLALYLQNGRRFPDQDLICLGEDIWHEFSKQEQFQARKKADEISYVWDQLIEMFCQDHHKGVLLGEQDVDAVEQALRTMAREDRFTRRGLGKSFQSFLEANQQGQARARICSGLGQATYVFLGCPVESPREDRIDELKARCLVARWLYPGKAKVIGIATETPKPGQGFSLDLVGLTIPDLTAEQVALAQQWQSKRGFFKNMQQHWKHEDEYPT